MQETSQKRMRIDLNRFKLHICLDDAAELTLHFNSASRRFYLSVIALLVIEMKKQGRLFSVPLANHLDLLALLNETVGGSVGASTRESLLPRIYRKWKSALPDIENAPLFKIVGRNKYYDEGAAKTYRLGEAEKDSWANLFEYKGSEENVRLRFSIDALGAGLDDVVLDYGELTDAQAWQEFIADQKKEQDSKALPQAAAEKPESEIGEKKSTRRLLPRLALAALIVLVVGAVGLVSWNYYLGRSQRVEPASLDKMAFPLPDKPSIAVLPFANLTGDPQQEYLSDGITEEIITALSKVPFLFVIARNSAFSYKEKPVKIRQVAEELGVRYVLEGSFRRVGDRVRITTQLIDAIKGHHLWAERYERELKDIFTLQDEITLKVLWALEVKLTEGEQGTMHRKVTDNLEAYLKSLQAMAYFEPPNEDNNLLARQMAEEAMALDPEYARPYRILALTYVGDVLFGTSKSPKSSMAQALELAQKAISLDKSDPCGYETLSFIYLIKRQHDRAIVEAERAIALDPNGADARYRLGQGLIWAGRPEEAAASLERAIRMNPLAPATYFLNLGRAYRDSGRYEEAIGEFRKAIKRSPDNFYAHFGLAAAYSLAGRDEEARVEVAEVLKIYPKASLVGSAKNLLYRNKADTDRIIVAMRKAGLPE
jgi:adenylate cyclase